MDRKKIIIAAVAIVAVVTISFVVLKTRKTQTKSASEALPTQELIPTVDSSVKVELSAKISGKEVILKISDIPKGTQSIEYSLSYDTKKQSMQGVIGTVTVEEGENEYEKDITLGTCSSGRCVYHEVVGTIKLSLKFIGDYGERIFEKEYEL